MTGKGDNALRLTDWLFGWREITADGDAAKFLTDLLLKENIPAEIRTDENATTVRVGRAAGKRIFKALSENGINVRVGEIRGLPGLFRATMKRPGAVCGVVLAVLFFAFARTRLWDVRIEGDGSVDEDAIREIVYAAGLRPGMKLREISPESVSSACLLHEDVFSGINVTLSGVVAKVEWLGREQGDPIASPSSDGVNVVASCDGVIVSVEPTSGTAVVVPGQTVHKGDLLISGVTGGGAVRASGKVTATVTREFTATVPKAVTTNRIEKKNAVSLSFRMFGEELFSIGAGGDSVSEKEWTLPGGIVLPFSFRVGYLHKTVLENVELTEAEAAQNALRRLRWIVREALAEGELIREEISGGFDDAGYTATAKTEYLINIAKPLAFTVGNEYNK